MPGAPLKIQSRMPPGALSKKRDLGYRVGDAQVSEKHADFIVNLGNARADDVLQLMVHVTRTAEEKDRCEIGTRSEGRGGAVRAVSSKAKPAALLPRAPASES